MFLITSDVIQCDTVCCIGAHMFHSRNLRVTAINVCVLENELLSYALKVYIGYRWNIILKPANINIT